VIQVEQLTKVYGATRAVEGLNFQIERGEIVGFLGPNGAGKSTTMRIIAGALGATEGRVRVDGVDVFEDPIRVKRMVGYLPEVPPLYPDMTVRGYLRYVARLKQATDPKRATESAIERVGLTDVGHRLIDHLSKGYRQRVGIAQALVHAPRVLILDEPASGLDPAQRVEIRHLVRELAQGDVTVILSTHVLPEVEAICDRAIIINEGRIVASDTLDGLSQAGVSVKLTVGRPDEALLQQLRGLSGVQSVRDMSGGTYVVTSERDVRAEAASIAVAYDLLGLSGQRGLEDAYLLATEAASTQSSAEDGGEA